ESIERTGLDPQRVAGQLVGEVHLALPVRQIAVFAPDKQTGRLNEISVPQAQTRSAEQSASPDGRSVVSLTSPTQPCIREPATLFVDEMLSARISREGGPLLVEAAALAGPLQTNQPQTDQEPWHLLVPMRVRGRLVGILALSRREDDQAYSDT